MIKKHLLQILIVQMIVSIFCVHSYALEKETHQDINEYIATKTLNGFSLDAYLKYQLRISAGVEETFESLAVWKWLGQGGKREDEPLTRSANHFHNPLTDQGFSGILNTGLFDGESAVTWAQKLLGTQDPGGHYSWLDTRYYFYKALTSTTKSEQDKYFAETFRGLGQLMHLVADMSVPEHTRDDGHYLGILPYYQNYEKYVLNYPEMIFQYPPIFFDASAIGNPNSLASVPIANLFDTNQYSSGASPAVTVNNHTIGLSEYTNANFLSPDTMFTSDLPYPNRDNCILSVDTVNGHERYYLSNRGDGEQVDHLAVVGLLYLWRMTYFPQSDFFFPLALDPLCYEEYASKLLPRAIGYSSDLLRYFFRGKVEVVSCLPIFWKNYIDRVKVTVKNVTPTAEAMANGSFSLVFRYTPVGGNPDGSDDRFIRASHEIYAGLPHEDEMELTFFLPRIISMDVYDSVKCMLVFRGALGAEKDAVIGKSFELGTVKFDEEWDNGLEGNHPWPWQHSTFSDEYGYSKNAVADSMLIKDLTSHKVNYNYYSFGQNSSWISFGEGIPITPNTYLQFRIVDMSINESSAHAFQMLQLFFNEEIQIQYFQVGGKCEANYLGLRPNTGYYVFSLGYIILDNIYNLFYQVDFTIPEPLYLKAIQFSQVLLPCYDPNVDIKHHMEVDFIRIVEGKKEQ